MELPIECKEVLPETTRGIKEPEKFTEPEKELLPITKKLAETSKSVTLSTLSYLPEPSMFLNMESPGSPLSPLGPLDATVTTAVYFCVTLKDVSCFLSVTTTLFSDFVNSTEF